MSQHDGITGKAYWRSLDELAQTPEFRAFVENEFPNHAAGLLDGPSRRQFLKIMGASFALAGLAGCRRWPEEKLAPFAYRPDGRPPGTMLQYATAMELGGVATGLLVTSYDGRPIKIEGNPLHPGSLGAASAIHQASVLELYDPDRSRSLAQREQPGKQPTVVTRTWDDFVAFARPHFDGLKKNGGAVLAVLSEAASGPSMADMRGRWAKAFPQARWCEYEPIGRDNEREGTRQAFGKPMRPQLHLDQADVILCLGADIFGTHPNALRYARDWAERRRGGIVRAPSASAGSRPASFELDRSAGLNPAARMPRLYVAESTYTITGSVADHRLPLFGGGISTLVEQLSRGLHEPVSGAFVAAVRKDLTAHRGRSLVIVGPEQPTDVHALAARLNAELGNIGQTITYTDELDADRPTHVEAIKSLVSDLREGKVNTLVMLGGNPVYDAPADLGFTDALAKVGTSIHLSGYENETSRWSHWHLPRAHYLEAWGDGRSWDGTISLVQPLIEPLFGGKSEIELLAALCSDEKTQGYDIVRRTFASLLPKDNFEHAWRKTLHDGVLPGTAFKVAEVKIKTSHASLDMMASSQTALADKLPVARGLELTFMADRKLYDGRFANNGWLQELPDPLTKVTWDNAALMSIADAEKLGVKTGDVIRLKVNARELEMAAYVMPGQATGSIAIPLGYGRRAAGQVGNDVGFDTYALRTTAAMHAAAGVEITKTVKTYALSLAQDHHAIDRIGFEERKRRVPGLIREVPLPIYQQHPNVVQEMGAGPAARATVGLAG